MLKTWLRRDRERVRRNLGHCVKAPPKFTDQQWASLRRYWESSGYKLKSEKMSQARGKVMFHPRVGRDGYAGKKAKLRSEQDNSSGLADVADVMKRVREGPLSALTETRNSNRLSEMERMHVETNKRIDDVVKSNLDLKDMLKSVLTTLTSCNRIEDTKLVSTDTPVPGSTSTKKVEAEYNREGQSGGSDSSEKWLDLLGKSSDDEPHENALAAGGSSLNRNSAKKGRNANGKSVPLNTTGAVGRNKALEIKSSPPRNISDTQVHFLILSVRLIGIYSYLKVYLDLPLCFCPSSMSLGQPEDLILPAAKMWTSVYVSNYTDYEIDESMYPQQFLKSCVKNDKLTKLICVLCYVEFLDKMRNKS
ncbi:hypothetical protein KC19_VG305500 [Ceratodon purpureus]|uniref:Uncharacterized protein n=1 Tax=Ceratodon purpureus TaxID=3225 RepID=A0A8T0HVB1_CERPU|nr:hypothetical protein KC19_VG305500 [Ceratodon purpureus]